MGRVWVAEHLTLETNVVVKFMAKEIAATADGAARFAREASVAAAVKSPHVVQVFDHGVTPDGDAYIVMELLEGHDLGAHLSSHGPMAPRDVAALVAQVAKALGKAHQVGVVHRDIKPDNIFLCEADGGELFVKLLDFGIAKREQRITDAATTTGAVVGTPYYMSPEQIVGEKDIDARTDIWSLGVVAFEAMAGKRPFDGSTVGAITLSIHTKVPLLTPHLPDAAPALDEWFARACARDPKERFQTAREAAQALLVAVGELPASAGLLRAPMPSMVGDGSAPSQPSLASGGEAPTSDGRVATSLSSVSPLPHPRRARPALVVAAIAVVAVLVGAMFVVPALLRPRATAGTASTSSPTLEDHSAVVPAAPVAPSAALAAPVDPAATASAPPTATSSVTRLAPAHAARPPTTAVKPPRPTKPARTRDDDDIK